MIRQTHIKVKTGRTDRETLFYKERGVIELRNADFGDVWNKATLRTLDLKYEVGAEYNAETATFGDVALVYHCDNEVCAVLMAILGAKKHKVPVSYAKTFYERKGVRTTDLKVCGHASPDWSKEPHMHTAAVHFYQDDGNEQDMDLRAVIAQIGDILAILHKRLVCSDLAGALRIGDCGSL